MRGRLTPEQVLEIRSLPSASRGRRGVVHPYSLTALAERYGVSRTAISEARSGRKWGAEPRMRQPKAQPARTPGPKIILGFKNIRDLVMPPADVAVRPVPGYDGRYATTADGRVWSYTGGWKTSHPSQKGYLRTALCVAGKSRTLAVHRLVALAWIPNPADLPQVNHINGIKSDNRVENLEWVTGQENARHAWAAGLYASRAPGRRKMEGRQARNELQIEDRT